ncbi:MAG: glycosyltransferase family 2 protein [Candidatus Korarchaeota archaeon]|nr:glycosyltransferase family 2 protein [Thermoproteota archaeon]
MPLLSIIIPTLNEESTIGKVIEAIPREILGRMGYEFEVIVVDGGSTDRTVNIALHKGARVIVVRRRGYGLAYLIGFRYAKGDVIVTLDADMTYPPSEIPKMLLALEKGGADFVSSNRFAKTEKYAFSSARMLGNRLINLFVFLLFRFRIRDTQSGMWCFKRKSLSELVLSSFGMEFSTEIKLEALRKLRFIEIPIRYFQRKSGKSKIRYMRDGLRIVLFIIKYRILSALGIV